MSHVVVKLKTDPFGEPIKKKYWHLSVMPTDCEQVFCTGEVYGPGVSAAEYEQKDKVRGGITCPRCLEIIRSFKKIKL